MSKKTKEVKLKPLESLSITRVNNGYVVNYIEEDNSWFGEGYRPPVRNVFNDWDDVILFLEDNEMASD